MKIRAQIGMVLNLDKCIGCHTCSVTCKNVWTSRPGVEYAWFNNVETKPGIGYPKEWENQDRWNGGWIRKPDGTLTARAIVSQRVPEGMTLMYHAQEKIINVPGAETSGKRGGIHNSVTRAVTKPTHMIGGYAQLSWGFNYYGTVGSNRDEFVLVRKMNKVDWLEGSLKEERSKA